MDVLTLHNPTGTPVKFRLAGAPGDPVLEFECAPGKTVDVPTSRASISLMERIAPALKPVESKPVEAKPVEPAHVEAPIVESASPTTRADSAPLIPKRKPSRRKVSGGA